MNELKGFRTIIANVVLGLFAIAAAFGFDVTPEQQAAIVNGAMALGVIVNIWLRMKTDTAVFNSKPQKKARRQGGFAQASFLFSILIGSAMLAAIISLQGCGSIGQHLKEELPWRPFHDCLKVYTVSNRALGACAASINILAVSADSAADTGVITKEVEHKALDNLQISLDILRQLQQMQPGLESDVIYVQLRDLIQATLDIVPVPEV